METALGHLTVALDIEGMSCASCVAHVEKALGAVDGVESVSVDLASRSATVTMKSDQPAPTERLGAAVERAGYGVIAAEVIDRTASPTTGDDAHVANPDNPDNPHDPDDDPEDDNRPPGPTRPDNDLREAAERRANAREAAERRETALERRDLLLSASLSAPLLVLGMSHGAIPFAGTETGLLFQLGLATVLVAVPGRRFFARALAALRRKRADMNTLVALGVGAAYVYSALAVLAPSLFPHGEHQAPHLYFEAAAAIVTFVLLGRLLESRARRKLSDAVRGLVTLIPKTAVRIKNDGDIEVPLSTIATNDLVRVRPGERVPADGTVVSGHATLDESVMTGESAPIDKSAGDRVSGGTLALSGGLVVRVTDTGEKSALGRIIAAIERARGERAPISRLADRVSAVFVPIVIGLALVTFFVWLALDPAPGVDPLQVALERMIAVLVIACPCALGLATPAAVAVGMGRGAELGILFRGGASLEALSRVDTVLLDKTGTLTFGAPELADVMSLGTDADRESMLRHVAALERMSEHPVGQAIARHTPQTLEVDGFESIIGGGVAGRVGGLTVLAGTESLLTSRGVDTAPLTAAARTFASRGQTPVLVAMSSKPGQKPHPAGVIAVADQARPESRAVVAELESLGATPHMVTGDRREAAAFVAHGLGIELTGPTGPTGRVVAEVDPEGKASLVARLQAEGRVVAMVGDGVNDAPALATADVGVAVASGTDIASAAADVTLARGVATLPTALRLAKRTLATIRRNLFWAFAYNVVGVPLAAGVFVPLFGWTLSPVFASLAMSLSSVSVLLSSLMLRRFQPTGARASHSGVS